MIHALTRYPACIDACIAGRPHPRILDQCQLDRTLLMRCTAGLIGIVGGGDAMEIVHQQLAGSPPFPCPEMIILKIRNATGP